MYPFRPWGTVCEIQIYNCLKFMDSFTQTQRKQIPIVKVTFESHCSYEVAISSDGVLIPGIKKLIKFCPEREHIVTRCYNCNKFGHILLT